MRTVPSYAPLLTLPQVPTLCISDCHHGAGKQDDYTQSRAMWEALEAGVADGQDWLADNPGAVAIFHGDILNGVDQGLGACLSHPTTLRALQLYGTLRQHNPVAGDDGRPIWVVGNHDAGVEKLALDVPALARFRFAQAAVVGDSYHVHGHGWDWACSGRWGWIGRACSRLVGWIGGSSPEVEDKLRAMGGRDGDWGAFHRTVVRDVEARNVRRVKAGQAPIRRVVCGHTHEEPCVDGASGGGVVYRNLGLGGRDGFTRLA